MNREGSLEAIKSVCRPVGRSKRVVFFVCLLFCFSCPVLIIIIIIYSECFVVFSRFFLLLLILTHVHELSRSGRGPSWRLLKVCCCGGGQIDAALLVRPLRIAQNKTTDITLESVWKFRKYIEFLLLRLRPEKTEIHFIST